MMASGIRIGPAKPGDPILALIVAPFGLAFCWFAIRAAAMPHPDDRAWAPWLAAVGVAILACALWLALKGVTARATLEIRPEGVVYRRLRPVSAELRLGWGDLVALHHGGLGDRHPMIRLEYWLPPAPVGPGLVEMPRRTAKVILPRHGFEMTDEAILALLRHAAEAAGVRLVTKSGVPVLGRSSWVVDHTCESVT